MSFLRFHPRILVGRNIRDNSVFSAFILKVVCCGGAFPNVDVCIYVCWSIAEIVLEFKTLVYTASA